MIPLTLSNNVYSSQSAGQTFSYIIKIPMIIPYERKKCSELWVRGKFPTFCKLPTHCLTASSYEGGTTSCPWDSVGNLNISKWWIGPCRSIELSTWFKFCSCAFSSSSQFVVSGSGSWRKLCQTVKNRRNNPPEVIRTGPAILQLLSEAVLPTTVTTAPARTNIIGVNFSNLGLFCWPVDWLQLFSIHWVVMISKGKRFCFDLVKSASR